MSRFFKSILILTFFINNFSFANNIYEEIEQNKIYNSHIWKSLLHINSDKPSINSKDFLFSFDDFSLKNELLKNVEQIKNNKHYPCKFPARYLWLTTNFPELKELKQDNIECREFNEYLEKTNADSIDLIFVSENIKNPSSMMGHIFFKINGFYDDKKRENSISFFTILNHLNIPILAYESIIKGMNGYFILSPYQTQIFNYVNKEERNIWEYKLNLTAEQQKLIYYHFWELKDIDITYYFTNFNCATIIDNMLSISSEDYYFEPISFWLTPKDVVKRANKFKLIQLSNTLPSLEWSLYMINENLDKKNIERLKSQIDDKNINSIRFSIENNNLSKLEIEFIRNYTKYLYIKKGILEYQEYKNIINLLNKDDLDFIDYSNYKNPINTQDSKQLSIGYLQKDKENFTKLGLLLAGNTLYDDNRNYFSENSLQIGNIEILANKSEIFLNKIDFYDMKSYLPINNILTDLSSEFAISYYNKFNNLYINNSLLIKGGVGLSNKLSADTFLYYLANFEVYIDKSYIYPVIKPKAGLNIYEILDMKTVLEYEYEYNLRKIDYSFHKLSLNQSINIDNNHRFDLNLKIMKNNKRENKIYSFTYNYFF